MNVIVVHFFHRQLRIQQRKPAAEKINKSHANTSQWSSSDWRTSCSGSSREDDARGCPAAAAVSGDLQPNTGIVQFFQTSPAAAFLCSPAAPAAKNLKNTQHESAKLRRAQAEYRCFFIGNRRKIQASLRAGLQLQLERLDLSLNGFRCHRQRGRTSAAWRYLAQLQLQHHAVIQLRRRLLRHRTAKTAQFREKQTASRSRPRGTEGMSCRV